MIVKPKSIPESIPDAEHVSARLREPRRTGRKTVFHRALLLAGLALSMAAFGAHAASVGPAGYTNGFGSQPAAVDFARGAISGASGDVTDAAGMDAAVATVTAASINAQLDPQLALVTGTPPDASNVGVYNDTGKNIQLRATSVKTALIMATLTNNSGVNATSVLLSYNLIQAAIVAEDLNGVRVYYSLTGSAGSWTHVPAWSATVAGLVNTNVTLTAPWNVNAPLYVLFADDNGSPSPDTANQIDNFYVAVGNGPLTITSQPQSRTNLAGTAASFTVGVSGATPYFFTWFKGASPLSGATNQTYSIPVVVTNDAGSYSVIVSNLSSSVTSTVASLTVNVTTPTVGIASPTNTQTFFYGSNLTISANAAAGVVTNVGFFADGVLIGNDTSAPFGLAYSNAAVGPHALTAVVEDNIGQRATSAVVNISVTLVVPTVVITTPTNTQTFSYGSNLIISANATAGVVTNVGFFADGVLIGNDPSSPFGLAYSNAAVGGHILVAVVQDNLGQSATSAVVNISVTLPVPTVVITAPTDTQAFIAGANITISATATAGIVTNVGFFADGVLLGYDTSNPYSFVYSGVPIGAYALTAVVRDDHGQSVTSAVVNITVVELGVQVGLSGAGPFGFETAPTVQGGWSTTNLAGGPSDLTTAAAVDAAIQTVSAANVSMALPEDGTLPPVIYPLDRWNSDGQYIQSRPTATRVNLLMATLRNASGADLAAFDVSYTFGELLGGLGEQVPGLRAFYSLTGVPNTWQAIPALTTGTTGALSATLTVTNWPAGSFLYLLWGDDNADNATNNEGAYSIDDFAISNVAVVVPPPTAVAITSPTNSQQFSLGTNITVIASTAGSVTNVDFYADGGLLGIVTNSPFSLVYSNATEGVHTLLAVARGTNGLSVTSAPINITVVTNFTPLVSLTSPLDGASYPPPINLTLTATASDADGTVTSVEFFVGATLLGVDTLSPFTFAWSNIALGTYAVTAVATDNAGVHGTSAPVQITVTINPTALDTAQYHTATLLPNGKVLIVAGDHTTSSYQSRGLVYDPATGVWTTNFGGSTARYFQTATLLLNGKVLVAGGYNSTNGSDQSSAELYDPATLVWTMTSTMNTARSQHTATLLPDGKLLVAGGYGSGSLASAELYDSTTGTWAAAGVFSTARFQHTATLLPNGKVLVVGGQDNNGSPLTSVQIYDSVAQTWTTTGSLNNGRHHHTATLLPNGKVLVVAGRGSVGTLSSSELFDPNTGTWTVTGALGTARTRHSATLLPNGKVLIAGGQDSGGVGLASAESFDPATGTWTMTAVLTSARDRHTATLLPNGKVLVVAGNHATAAYLTGVELYDSANGTWTATGTPSTHHSSHAAMLLPNGKVLAAGSYGISSAELYDSATAMWTASGAMSIARTGYRAVLLPNGKLLVAGGSDAGGTALAVAELFDPTTGNWTVTGAMNSARIGHTATLLPDGKVMISGGYNQTNGYLSSSELYDPTVETWTMTSAMSSTRWLHTATLLPTGKVLIAGGYNNAGGNNYSSALLYDPVTRTWTATGSMSAGRSGHSATLLPNGKVLIAAGDGDGFYHTGATLYDPATGTWVPTGSMNAGTGRSSHTATLLHNGQVLIAGGQRSDLALSSAALYDPALGTWTEISPLSTARRAHAATVLTNGKVLVVGGYNEVGGAGAELFDPGLGFNLSWQPQITSYPASLNSDTALTLAGTQFRGVSGGSGGNVQDSPGDNPVVQLRSLESGQTVFLRSTNWSTNSYTSTAVSGLPSGWIMATMFVNGIPSAGVIMSFNSFVTSTAVTITSPTNTQNFFVGANISVNATTTGSVTNVDFYADGGLIGNDTTSPHSHTYGNAGAGPHTLFAVATDDLGLSSTSAVVSIQVVANLAPTISLTNPPGNLNLAAFGNFTLGAGAADSDGSVTNVEFYNGLSLLGADSTSPYSYSWSNIPIGTHQIFAVVVDNYGLRATSAVVSVTAQGPGIPVGLSGAGPFGFGTPPTVQDGWSTTNLPGGSLEVTTAAQLDAAIQNVAAANVFAALPADGTVPPAGFTLARWNSAGFYLQSRANGAKAILLMATLRNNVGADVTSFTVSYDFGDLSGLAEQVPGLRVFYSLTGASNTWQAVPALTTGTTGALTATLAVGNWPAGSAMYLLWGDDNASTTDGAYTIDNFAIANVLPTIPLPSLTEPTNGATYDLSQAPGITLSAIVTNNPGAVTKVEFYRGETLLGSDSASPYSMVWNNPPAGACTLRAVAVDIAGGRGTSAPVQISVTMSQPVLDARQLTNGVFQLTLSGQTGQAYAIDRSPDLLNWTEWIVFTNQASQTQLQDPGATNTGVRFYRGRHVPQP